MSLKILIVFICAAIGTAAGFYVMKSYRRKYEYLSGICALVGELKRNIAYRRDGAASIVGGMTVDSAHLKKNIDEYVSYAVGKADKPTISRGFLSRDVYAKVCELFSSLGRTDGAAQIDELEMYEKTFDKLCSDAEQKSAKYGAVAVKLGFLFGLGVGILTL